MQVFIEFKNPEQRDWIVSRSSALCQIVDRVRNKNQYWFQPHDNECYNAFTEWLDAVGIEYENV